ncbi:hypothetical protein [Streptomyces sp900105755]|uniref:Uncharacterized protein n=1 Tax=Streptomyces sp. 900105755 TaxID=3154389 RepID=A0ABV1TBY7_9ACTN
MLGFDTERSADDKWGPRLQLFLHSHDVNRHAGRIGHVLAEHLPTTFHRVDPATRPYHSRPYRVLRADRLTQALTPPASKPRTYGGLRRAGGVDQFVDSTEVLSRPGLARAAADAVTAVDAHDGPPRGPAEGRRSQSGHRE